MPQVQILLLHSLELKATLLEIALSRLDVEAPLFPPCDILPCGARGEKRSQRISAAKPSAAIRKRHYFILKRTPSTSLSIRVALELLMFQIMTKSLSGGPFCSILGVNVGLMWSMSYRSNHFN